MHNTYMYIYLYLLLSIPLIRMSSTASSDISDWANEAGPYNPSLSNNRTRKNRRRYNGHVPYIHFVIIYYNFIISTFLHCHLLMMYSFILPLSFPWPLPLPRPLRESTVSEIPSELTIDEEERQREGGGGGGGGGRVRRAVRSGVLLSSSTNTSSTTAGTDTRPTDTKHTVKKVMGRNMT